MMYERSQKFFEVRLPVFIRNRLWLLPVSVLLLMATTVSAQPVVQDTYKPDVHEWFWFIYERNRTPVESNFTIRPFYTRHVKGDDVFQASLMPVLFWKYEKTSTKDLRGLFGFIDSLEYQHPAGVRDYDLGVFPFIYYGSSPDSRDRYLMVWPFGGTVRGKIGQEDISAWVFPGFLLFIFFPPWSIVSGPIAPYVLTVTYAAISFMPLYTEYGRGDYRARGILWPVYTRGKGGNLEVFRIFPFYSRSIKKGWYDNRSYFLICNYSETYFRDSSTHYNLFIVPFYGHKWSSKKDMEATTVLWPFFTWGHNDKTGEKEYNIPWPFVQIKDSVDPPVYKRIYFPFYGNYTYKKERSFFITPLYFTLHNDGDTVKSAYYYYCMIIWYFRRDYDYTHPVYGRSWRFFKIWPLMKVEYNDQGDQSFNLLSMLPLRDTWGYEALYEPFWSVIEYRRRSSGEKRLGILFRTYYQRWGDDYFQVAVPFIIGYWTSGGHIRSCNTMFRMFGYSNKPEGRYIYVLWIPVRTGDGDPETPTERELRIQSEKLMAKADIHNNMVLARRELDRPQYPDKGILCTMRF